jgi:SAM-dependent methyltransferase
MDIRLLANKIWATVKDEGIRALGHKAVFVLSSGRSVANHSNFDREYGTDTAGIHQLWRYSISSPNGRHGIHYDATNEDDLTAAIAALAIDPRQFCFLDLGCGKGRCLIVAHKLGFRRVIGVEFAAELVQICRGNLARLKIDAEALHTDAATYQPPDEMLVMFLYNPFTETVLRDVVERLRDVRQKTFIIYNNPVFGTLLDQVGFLERMPIEMPRFAFWQLKN